MGSWASEFFRLLATTDPLVTPVPVSRLFLHGGMIAGTISAIIALSTAIYFLFRSQHRDLEATALALNQIASTEFERVVLRESRRVFLLVDEHLPPLLSQSASEKSRQSRFDQFCDAIKKIPTDQLDNRGHYSEIVKLHLGSIISDNVASLLDSLDTNDPAPQHEMLNPTRARFGLEGDTFLTFVVVSKFDSRNRGIESWFRRTFNATAVLLILPLIASASALVATTIDTLWAEKLGTWSVWIGVSGLFLAAVAYLLCFLLKNALTKRARRFNNPAVIEKYFDDQKGRHGR